jgi:uncharacterized repeat protein (TIGR03806 family)
MMIRVLALLIAVHYCAESADYGLDSRPAAKAYLNMPERVTGALPALLSQTGAFADTSKLVPSPSLIPYDINVGFWSDGAAKQRWVAVPSGGSPEPPKVQFAPTGEWKFPPGTVFVKHFELGTDDTQPGRNRRLETRLLVCDSGGSVYGVTYKWRPDNTDAELLTSNLTEAILIRTGAGYRTQHWYYPSRADCRTCHTDNAGAVLGVKTRQMNREVRYASGVRDNELRAWNHAGLLAPKLDEAAIPTCAKLARVDDASRSVEDRARSYLDANCAHCHRPGGTVASFDTRYDTPLAKQGLIQGEVLIDQGIDGARAIAPNDTWRSLLYLRVSTLDANRMPPLAHGELDREGVSILRQWIESLPGPPVLAPPVMSPRGGQFAQGVEVTLSQGEPGASIHYTLDGSVPTRSDPLYEKPINVTGPTVLRAKAFKPGFTRSVTVQGTFMVGE